MIYIKILKQVDGHKVGSCLRLKSADGVCLDPFWRNRIKDSKRDKCVEVLKKKPKVFLNG